MVALDSTSRSLVQLHIACLVIDTVAVALRFLAKVRTRARVSWDDGFMLVAWATLVAYIGSVIRSTLAMLCSFSVFFFISFSLPLTLIPSNILGLCADYYRTSGARGLH